MNYTPIPMESVFHVARMHFLWAQKVQWFIVGFHMQVIPISRKNILYSTTILKDIKIHSFVYIKESWDLWKCTYICEIVIER